MKCIRVAIIGAGYMASEHLKVFDAHPNSQVVGIYSRTQKNAYHLVQDYGDVEVFDSVKELYDTTEADVVIVTVPELSVQKVFSQVSKYSWSIFLEKPAGYNLNDASEILCMAGGRSDVYVGLNRRYLAATLQAKNELDNMADQRFIVVQDQQNVADALKSGQPKLVAENFMFANSIHLIDYIRFFCRGDLLSVTKIKAWDPTNPGVVVVGLEYSSGDYALYEGIWSGPGPWGVAISTPTRRFEMKPLETLKTQSCGSRLLDEMKLSAMDLDYKPGLYAQANDLINAVSGNASKIPTLSEAFETMKLIDNIFS